MEVHVINPSIKVICYQRTRGYVKSAEILRTNVPLVWTVIRKQTVDGRNKIPEEGLRIHKVVVVIMMVTIVIRQVLTAKRYQPHTTTVVFHANLSAERLFLHQHWSKRLNTDYWKNEKPSHVIYCLAARFHSILHMTTIDHVLLLIPRPNVLRITVPTVGLAKSRSAITSPA